MFSLAVFGTETKTLCMLHKSSATDLCPAPVLCVCVLTHMPMCVFTLLLTRGGLQLISD